ncbi:CaiB/BaiF CoA transferase family protein [Bordetella hinzii]|uniref:CoA-transferase family III protein n=1 Tax=Bordetella hinzii OH87 BAL007II TaxID=1331262 RepID=A0ABR4QYC1_9BORD|nr:CoA transferase [Bordetella hinzii]AKQ53994.1 Succinyl-CoA:(R)-benzylsuccinate CoA-transferase subunit BbsF [Bordetella hinzii]KCB22602.1 CoA-transferase family III protein [Bordetella hinzii OH87 BAL007II]KCB33693.1 CoA-transferase family III protein [Bordetella hinzii L60]KCB41779.1 CoA-transferase family III protein [Bordetella hinzii 5132]QDJ31752.1 CoA transferase [Bordetella hinzii]
MVGTISKSALNGVVVLDVSRVLAGPFAAQMLGDHGAEVIKVESYDGDDTRGYGPPFVDGDAPYYIGLNRNKQDLAVDLSLPAGRDILFKLLEDVDVLVENFKLSTWRKWGIEDPAALARRFPRLIHCRVSGFGETGPMGGLPGYDAAVQAISGLMSINGDPALDPVRIGIPIVDTSTGMNAVIGVLLALYEREKSGRGQSIEVTLFDTALGMLHPHTSNALNGGKSARTGNGHPNIVPYDLYPTRTEKMFVAVGNDRQFARLCDVLGKPELAADERFRRNSDRVVNREALRQALSEQLAKFDGQELFRQLMDLGVPCAPMLSVEQALALEHTGERQMSARIGQYRVTGIPVKLDRTPGALRLPPPGIGEHSREVMRRFGFSDADIAAAIDAGAVRQA